MTDEYTFEMTGSDIGEMIEIIRVQYLKLNDEVFCDKIGISPKLLYSVEEGNGPHGMMVMKKIHKTFPDINVSLSVEIKQ